MFEVAVMADNMKVVHNFINGLFVEPASKKYIDSYNPAIGKVHVKISDSDERDVAAAVKSAKQVFPEWSQASPQFRSKIMLQIADLIEKHSEELVHLESEDQGKSVSLARRVDIPRAIYNFRFFATSILHEVNESTLQQVPCNALSFVDRVPLGVAGLISPWNLPLYLLTWKVAPAIAFGNTCVAKPSEMTSLSANRLAEIINMSDIPKGVINFVYGYGSSAGEAVVTHEDVSLISFTGSTLTGKRIMEKAAPFCKKLSLEMGGKNAAVIFDDANLDSCLGDTVRSSFANQGEVCLCTSRIYVQRSLYDAFVKQFVELVKGIKVGDPSDPSTVMGALISNEHMEKVKRYIDIARKDGGVIECGDGVQSLELPDRCARGYFMLPTVITGLDDSSACLQDEIFGPVTCIMPFDTESEVIKRANNVKYGLSGTLWTQDISRAHRVARQLHVGTLWVNCWLIRNLHMPFGGFKMSGIGRESAEDSRDFFTEKRTICIKY